MLKTSFHLDVLEACDSTNDLLMQKRDLPDFHGHAILAKRQLAGQGRRGRTWWSGEGNLALSVGFRLDDPKLAALLPFAAGIAMAEILNDLPVRLKWPNDIYLNGQKFAGLLSQARQQGTSIDLVLGIGANLSSVPPESSVPAISLAEFGKKIGPVDFANDFLMQFELVLARLKDFSALNESWEKYAKIQGAKIQIVGEEMEYEGVGIVETGELQVIRDGKMRLLSSEEISVRFL